MLLWTTGYILQIALHEAHSRKQLLRMQTKKMRRIVRHAYAHSKFYRQLFNKNNIKPSDIKSIEDLKKIPHTRRRDVQLHFEDFITRNPRKLVYAYTTGSTGTPLKTAMNLKERHISR